MKMKSMALTALLLLAAAPVIAQEPAAGSSEAEKDAATRTALDYSDGTYSGDAARIERAIHPDLNKLFFSRRSPTMGLAAGYTSYSVFVELVKAGMLPTLDPDKRLTEVSVLELKDDIACAKIRSAQWCDYLQMVKIGGQWKIINVLWTLGLSTPLQAKVVPGFDAEKERPAAKAAALDYVEGRMSGDVARLERVLHPETNQVAYMVAAKTNGAFLSRTRFSGILEPVKAKIGLTPENERQAEVRVLDLMDGMAFAAAEMPSGAAYLQMQLMDGQWKVINVLVRPANNTVPQQPPAKR